jgi:hypothetical protein
MTIFATETAFHRAAGIVPVADCLLDAAYVAETRRLRNLSARHAGVPPQIMEEGRAFGDHWPRIRFFRTLKKGKPAAGWYHPGLPMWIWIHADVPADDLPRVVAHEVHHFAEGLQGRAPSEVDAEAFAAEFARSLAPNSTRGLIIRPSIERVYAPPNAA